MYLLDPSLIGPEPVTQTLRCEVNLRGTPIVSLKYSHAIAFICNVAGNNSNKWTFIFNASMVASLSTQHYGA